MTSPLEMDLTRRLVPFMDFMRIDLLDHGTGVARFRMRVENRHLRTLGIMHGGMASALLDTALGGAVVTVAPEDFIVVTVQLNVNFVRPAWDGEELIASGEVMHRGRQTAVARGEIRTAEGMLVSTATGTFMFLPEPKGDRIVKHAETTASAGTAKSPPKKS